MYLGEPIRSPSRRGRRFWLLRRRLDEVAAALGVHAKLVPADQSDVDRIHAFRLLAHAELQSYIEEVAGRVLDVTADKANSAGVLTHAGHHLIVFYCLHPLSDKRQAMQGRYPPYPREAALRGPGTGPALAQSLKRHRDLIERNNGVKQGNVRPILLPLGYRDELFPPGLLDQLDALGRDRGTVAHQSGLVSAASWPTGSSEIGRINSILPGLLSLEKYVPRLLRPA